MKTFWIILSGLGLFLEDHPDSTDIQLKCLTTFLLKSPQHVNLQASTYQKSNLEALLVVKF